MAVDDTLLKFARENLYAAVISDTLDAHGMYNQALPPQIRPVDEASVLCGRVRTGLYMAIYHDSPEVDVYEHEIALVDDLRPGEVPVLACGGNLGIAPWGELLSTAARARGAAGCVTDGSVRDLRQIRGMGFPVFAGGIGPLDTKGRGKLMWYDVPARIGSVGMVSGDVIFGDVDGAVVIPAAVAERVLNKAIDKVEGENTVRDELAEGTPLAAVFAKHGIL